MEEDCASTLWYWLFTMNLMLGTPVLAIAYYFKRVVDLYFAWPPADVVPRVEQGDRRLLRTALRRVPYHVRACFVVPNDKPTERSLPPFGACLTLATDPPNDSNC